MVTIQVKNIEGKTTLPVAGSALAAGYDIVAVDDPIIVGESITREGEFHPFYRRIDYIEYHTALFISPQESSQFTHHNRDIYHTLLHPRSSVRKYNLVLANSIGLVDNDYRGEIICCFKYIWQPEDFIVESVSVGVIRGKLLGQINREKIYKKGDKIAQLVAEKTNPISFHLVSELDATDRGVGGFGSTDAPKKVEVREVVVKEPLSVATPHAPEAKTVFGDIAERYAKLGGIPIKKRYSDEVKERESQ